MAFVVSAGQLSTIEAPGLPAMPTSVRLSDSLWQDYSTIWRSQPQVRTVVSFLARNIAQLGVHVFRRVSETDRERLRDHPLSLLIAEPNPWTTRYRLIDALVHDLGIYDDAYWLKAKRGGGDPAVVRIPPTRIAPADGSGWVAPDSYVIRGNRGEREVAADQIVHFRGYNPDDDRVGVSPIETLRGLLAEEYEATQYRGQLWRNGARFSGYLKRPADAPDWSKTARERFKSDWQSQYAGAGPQAGGTPILEDGMDFVPAAVTPEQAQYLQARKLTREEVAAAYHIPPPMVGILEHATFSNITEQHKNLYQDTLGPWLQMIVEDIALQLLPDLGDTDGVYAEFNLQEKLRGSFEEQAKQLQSAVGAPWLTRNEARARQNLPQIAGGDQLVVPLNVLVGGQASPTDSAPMGAARRPRRVKARVASTHVDKHRQVLSAFFVRQRDVIASRLGAAKTRDLADVWDDARWDAELTADLFAVSTLTATDAAHKTLAQFGLDPDEYDEDRSLAFLQSQAERVAGAVNAVTKAQLLAAVADADDDVTAAVGHVFDVASDARAAAVARTQITALSGFGSVEAARQTLPKATKTWVADPDGRHASLDGETVPVDEPFSNGAQWPADAVPLDVDEVENCACGIDINAEV